MPDLDCPFRLYYSFYMMAMDETAALEGAAPPFLAAAWTVARCAGPWWAFRGAVVLSERPAELHLNGESLLHRPDGPAAVFRDGSFLRAWNGRAIPKPCILHPDEIPPSVLAGLNPAFRKFVRSRAETTKLKPSAILKQEMPAAAGPRARLLRRHNDGSLPLFDRYQAGDHRRVWEELAALGPSVRQDPHAADALAVAYETMRRVRENARTVTVRLKAPGYKKGLGKVHEPPTAASRMPIPRIEQIAGGLPLSIRAFFDVVGAVNWMEHDAAMEPRKGPMDPDPLVVISTGFELARCEEEGRGSILIKPKELCSRDSRAYELEVPNLGADGKLLNQRHDVYFVEYLRLAFRFGGFPGYDGIDRPPGRLARLSAGLVEF